MAKPNLLELTLAEARRDQSTVTKDGRPIAGLPHGSSSRPLRTHVDDRGSLFEIFDRRWNFDDEPFTFVYSFTVRPGVVKGWGLHKLHQDRYALISGDMQLVLYDVRPDSPTCGQVFVVPMSETNRQLVNIPAYVWHADYNPGTRDAVLVNMPTQPYDHENPEKYRLPIDTPLIPYDFGNVRGG